MINSIIKGKRFERQVANLLSKKLNKKFLRVPMSGGKHDSKNTVFKGDVFCDEEEYKKWCIECKSIGKKLNLQEILNQDGLIYQWWEQTVIESGNQMPILFFKFNSSPTFVLTTNFIIIKSICKEWIRYAFETEALHENMFFIGVV